MTSYLIRSLGYDEKKVFLTLILCSSKKCISTDKYHMSVEEQYLFNVGVEVKKNWYWKKRMKHIKWKDCPCISTIVIPWSALYYYFIITPKWQNISSPHFTDEKTGALGYEWQASGQVRLGFQITQVFLMRKLLFICNMIEGWRLDHSCLCMCIWQKQAL